MPEDRFSFPPSSCIGDLTMDEVRLDQLRQAIFDSVERIADIPVVLAQLTATDWSRWMSDAGGHVAVCAGCNHYARTADVVASDLPWLSQNVYCHECNDRLLAEHTFVCDVCAHTFIAQYPPTPFKVCPECDGPSVTIALSSLQTQLQRARKLNLPATLTPRQWLDTLEYFGWRCAYCLRADFACMDHYIPIVQGGGTTMKNCVPACTSCNSAKGGRPPQGYLIKASAFTRVKEYLEDIDPSA